MRFQLFVDYCYNDYYFNLVFGWINVFGIVVFMYRLTKFDYHAVLGRKDTLSNPQYFL